MYQELLKAHRFFVSKSRWYVSNQNRLVWVRRGLSALSLEPSIDFKDWCYYPIAYCKFMCYSIKDIQSSRNPE